jgi:ribonucleoside-diphosphate reductase alpha chain
MIKNDYGPKTVAADSLHATKYREPGEGFREAMNRVAFGLADDGDHYHEFREILLAQRFLPGGRVQGAIGASRKVTPYNCFVMPTIADSFISGENSIMDVAKDAAATMRMGGGVGYDFSTLRPRGDLIMKLASHSSGPINFMSIFDAICKCVASSGHRRGAQMGVLRVDHPDAEEFVRAKQNATNLTAFNVSLAVTDGFMDALARKSTFDLKFAGRTYKTVDAEDLWEKIMRSTYDWAEPGVLFIDRINAMNNLWYCETLAAVNPCAEQPLPPYGACLLGSFNLAAYLTPQTTIDANGPKWSFDFDQLGGDILAVVRAMDNVVDRALYPLPAQAAEARNKRRMGLGVTGLANAAEACGFPYGSPEFIEFEEKVLDLIKVECYRASAGIAAKKGAFPLFDAEKYLAGKFIETLPDDVRAAIAKDGIRNSHLTSIAPTGTISMCADNVSSSIEPVFSYSTTRPINTPDGPVLATVEDYGAAFLGVRGKISADVTAAEHVAVLVAAQRHVDSAVSKTCNVDGSMSYDEFKGIYLSAYEGGAKGCTTFRQDGKRMALLTPTKAEPTVLDGAACEVDPATGRRNCE